MGLNIIEQLKQQKADIAKPRPATNIAIHVTGYDTESSNHAILGKMVENNKEVEIRLLLAEDPEKENRKKPRAEIADRANPHHKAYIEVGGWIYGDRCYKQQDTDGVSTFKANWLETIAKEPNIGFAATRYASVEYRERSKTDPKNYPETIVIKAFDPEKAQQVNSYDDFKKRMIEALTPQHKQLGPLVSIRASSGESAVSIEARTTQIEVKGEEYRVLQSGEKNFDGFMKTEQANIVRQFFQENGKTSDDFTVELIPGTSFKGSKTQTDDAFDENGNREKKTNFYHNIYNKPAEDDKGKVITYKKGPRKNEPIEIELYTPSIIGLSSFTPPDGGAPVPICAKYMPVTNFPEKVLQEYMPTSSFEPTPALFEKPKLADKTTDDDIPKGDDELGLSAEDADALAEINDIMAPTP